MNGYRKLMTLLLIVAALAIIGIALLGWPGLKWWVAGLSTISIAIALMLWRSVMKPMSMMETGYNMLKSQDFNNRLRNVGEIHADMIADVFNTMMSNMKEERLRLLEQQGFLNKLIQVSPMGIALLDYDGRITLMNPAFRRMAGIEAANSAVTGTGIKGLGGELGKAILSVPEGESEVFRLNGTCIYRISNLWFMEKGFRRSFILVESLTEDVMKAEREAYGKVIRVLSHEVNNTIGGVNSLLETMTGIVEDEELHEVLESGIDRCKSLSEFIKSYTNVVKLSDPVKEERDLNGEIMRILPFLEMLKNPGTEISMELCEGDMRFMVDSVMLEQVIINIIKNADESIQESRESAPGKPGKILIKTLRTENKDLTLEISDNGAGIDRDKVQKIFTPFYSTKNKGRGIGLTLVSEILTRHGFTFTLRTDDEGITRFRIRIDRSVRHLK